RLEQQVVARSRIAQRLREVDVDPTHSVHLPVEPDAVGVRLRRQAARALNERRQPISLGLQCVGAGITDLANDGDRALQLELRLPENQDVIVWLQRYLGRTRLGEGEARWADVATGRVALEQVRRVHRRTDRRRELPLRAVLRYPRDLGLLEVGPQARPACQQHQVPRRHSFGLRIHSRLLYHTDDGDGALAGRSRQLVDSHAVAG